MKKIIIVSFVLLMFASLSFADGDIYTYKDKNGVTVISNTPIPEKYQKKTKRLENNDVSEEYKPAVGERKVIVTKEFIADEKKLEYEKEVLAYKKKQQEIDEAKIAAAKKRQDEEDERYKKAQERAHEREFFKDSTSITRRR
jgi:hypothetical protein